MVQTLREFTLAAPPNSDIWKKPPQHDVFNAPHNLNQTRAFPLSLFQSARITFSAIWEEKFDQAGILLVITDNNGQGEKSWIKAGLESFNSIPQISFVGCDRWADWSLHPLHAPDPHKKVTVELRREGFALWAYELVLDGEGQEVERWPFRECTWPWHNEQQKTVQVAAMTARPADGEKLGNLEVKFDELRIQTSEA